MLAKQVSVDYWRNFKPFAPDIEIEVLAGVPFDIDLKDYLIQGARDQREEEVGETVPEDGSEPEPIYELLPPMDGGPSPSEGILDKVPVQRGWLLYPVVVNTPVRGFVRSATYQDGLQYTSRADAEEDETDCFNYMLTNGTQQSNYGKISIKVVPYYVLSLEAFRYYDGTYVFQAHFDHNAERLKSPNYIKFAWYRTEPKSVWNEDLQVFEVSDVEVLFYTTHVEKYKRGRFAIIDQADITARLTLEDDSEVSGVIKGTTIPYRPTGKLPSIRVECILMETWRVPYGHVTYHREFERIEADLSTFYGDNWWESGNIQEGEI